MLAQLLTDLAMSLQIAKLKGKAAYNQAMKGHSLQEVWKEEHTQAFLQLKIALASEPVLQGPKYNGMPFIVTMDGCKFGFAGMLTQKHTTILPSGKEVTRLHPVGFVSKRTSVTEEKYKPFILEFVALKYSLDKFSDIMWGFPVKLKTDCQALRDHLLNDKISAMHARWRNTILDHNITNVHHRPGRLNTVADSLSCKYVNVPYEDGDGHKWTVSENLEAWTGLVNNIMHVNKEPLYEKLHERFEDKKLFVDIIDTLLELDQEKSIRNKKRVRHRAEGYMIEDGRLWKVGDVSSTRSRARVECMTKEEAVVLASEIHQDNGHFHQDNIKMILMDKIASPKLDQSIMKAIMRCGHCKGFGTTHLHSLLELITQ